MALLVALAAWAATRLGVLDLWATVRMPDGSTVRFPDGFAIVDHPFHAVRAETLRRALADGELLRWIGHHQGGYPVEFYPLGVAWLDLAVWLAALGSLPMMAVHKITVIATFLLPAVGYALVARGDRRSLGVAVLAAAGHLAVRGWWWSGGAMELIEWGLVTNVAGATAAFLALPSIERSIRTGSRRAGAGAALLCAAALVCNPRSGIALGAVVVGALLATWCSARSFTALQRGLAGAVVIAGLTALLAAPLIVSLARFGDLYYFVHYSGYDDLRAYLDSSIRATGGLFFLLGVIGLAIAWVGPVRPLSRAVSASALVYVAVTAFLALSPWPPSLIGQLEATRLMPFQRLLWFWLAAVAVEWAVRKLAALAIPHRAVWIADAALLGAVALTLLAYVIAPPSFIPESDRGLVPMPTSAQPGIVDLERAVRVADRVAPAGTAILVLGTTLSWHDQLWAPLWSDRPFFYDDWLWYWQTRHYGDYDPEREHAYRSDASALDPAYLGRHGIGAVIVTGDARGDAGRAAWLARERTGIWNVYLVRNAVTIVTFGGTNATSSDIEGQTIAAVGAGPGAILVRRNWFPRWRATVNGEAAAITRSADGYMSVSAGPDAREVRLTYRVDALDWLARVAAIAGVAIAAALLLGWPGATPRARWGRRSASADHGSAPP